ncbi:unnamed protein product [Clavelina lepadiformis]|uniref:Carbohydrate sulfotransferase n=1 Tax=Clavelina lepadiformis TaxID=159417 RepID=A0ABP0F7L2_CLALP
MLYRGFINLKKAFLLVLAVTFILILILNTWSQFAVVAKRRNFVLNKERMLPFAQASNSMTVHTSDNIGYTEDMFIANMAERMQQRKAQLKQACESLGLHEDEKRLLRINFSKEYKFAYCYIPKVGTTHMKGVLMELNGHTNWTPDDVHILTAKRYLFKGENLPESFRNFIKLIVVRHPYERIISSYNDKVANPQEKKFIERSGMILEKYGSQSRQSDGNNQDVTSGVENHWNSFNSICQPCAIDYDVIAHLETIDDDSRYLLRLIGAPKHIQYSEGYGVSGKSKTAQKNLTASYLRKLDILKRQKLYQAFEADFLLFNYSPDVQL